MIERQFVAQKIKEKNVQDYISSQLKSAGHTRIEIRRTPLGEKVIVYTTRPGLVVGMRGENIKKLTKVLKVKFKMENPQIEVGEITNPNLDPSSIADKIKFNFERYGPRRFKFLGYDTLKKVMEAGALGAEIIIGGRGVPGERAKSWRFSAGYLKKSGDVAESKIWKSRVVANLKTGSIGIKVSVMPPDLQLPDKITIFPALQEVSVEKLEESKNELTKENAISKTKTGEEIKEEAKEKPKNKDKKKISEKKVKEETSKKEIKESSKSTKKKVQKQ